MRGPSVLVGPIRCQVTIRQARCDVERVVAVRGRLEFRCSFNDDPVLPHQPPDTPLTHIDANRIQVFGHPKAAIELPRLSRGCYLMWARTTMSMCCLRLAGRPRKAHNQRWLTFMI